MDIPAVRINLPALRPFIVQTRATENWASSSAHDRPEDAMEAAAKIRAKYPALPVRIAHHKPQRRA